MDTANTLNFAWLVSLLAVGAAALWLKDQPKKTATIGMMVLMTLYVGTKYYQSIFVENRLSKAGPAIDVDRAELMLRLGSAFESFKGSALESVKGVPGGAAVVATSKPTDSYGEAEKVLEGAAKADPDSATAWAKLIVVQQAHKANFSASFDHLGKIKTPVAQELTKALKAIYVETPAIAAVPEVKKEIETELPSGWYQERALETLYKKVGDRASLKSLQEKTGPKSLSLFLRMVALALFGILAFLIGLIIIFVQLLFIGRNAQAEDDGSLVKAPVHSGAATIYGVFIGWQATQLMIGTLAQHVMKSLTPFLKMSSAMEPGSNKPVLIALTLAGLYLLSNLPGTLYAYLFTMRPSKISFLEGFRLRTHVGKRGPIYLVLAGIATWFVAVPLVLGSAYIGNKLGSQGSSNPVIALVMEAARSGNLLSTILFYLTLGVLAPLCEETLFRGFLYANLRRTMGVFPSMLVSAGLFAACHLDMGAFLPLFTLGSLFALAFEKTKSILPSMIAHGLWNSGTFTLLLLLFGN